MTADPTGQELNIGERINYTRAHLPAEQRERYEHELREGRPSGRLPPATTARSAT